MVKYRGALRASCWPSNKFVVSESRFIGLISSKLDQETMLDLTYPYWRHNNHLGRGPPLGHINKKRRMATSDIMFIGTSSPPSYETIAFKRIENSFFLLRLFLIYSNVLIC